MTNYFQEALQLKDKMIENRRHLHQIPEVGLELPETKAFVKGKLEALGLTVKEYGESGLSVLIEGEKLSLIHISEPTRQCCTSRMPSSA